MSKQERIERALNLIEARGGIDGKHHKQWVLDQVVRALTGCPMEPRSATDCRGMTYQYEAQGESDEYRAWIAAYQGEWSEDDECWEYEWDTGIAP